MSNENQNNQPIEIETIIDGTKVRFRYKGNRKLQDILKDYFIRLKQEGYQKWEEDPPPKK